MALCVYVGMNGFNVYLFVHIRYNHTVLLPLSLIVFSPLLCSFGISRKRRRKKKMKMREFVFSFPHRSSVNNELSFPLCVLLYTFDGKVYVNIIYYISRAEL